MALSWITALKLVPWGDVIEAAPQVIKAARGLVRKKDTREHDPSSASGGSGGSGASLADAAAPATSAGERALRQARQLRERVELLEQSQRQSLEVIEKLAEQNAQLVATASALRIGAQRLFWACAVLGIVSLGLVIRLLAGAASRS